MAELTAPVWQGAACFAASVARIKRPLGTRAVIVAEEIAFIAVADDVSFNFALATTFDPTRAPLQARDRTISRRWLS